MTPYINFLFLFLFWELKKRIIIRMYIHAKKDITRTKSSQVLSHTKQMSKNKDIVFYQSGEMKARVSLYLCV